MQQEQCVKSSAEKSSSTWKHPFFKQNYLNFRCQSETYNLPINTLNCKRHWLAIQIVLWLGKVMIWHIYVTWIKRQSKLHVISLIFFCRYFSAICLLHTRWPVLTLLLFSQELVFPSHEVLTRVKGHLFGTFGERFFKSHKKALYESLFEFRTLSYTHVE